jgi:positive regulator of sigma E activity
VNFITAIDVIVIQIDDDDMIMYIIIILIMPIIIMIIVVIISPYDPHTSFMFEGCEFSRAARKFR